MEHDPHNRRNDISGVRGMSATQLAEELERILEHDPYDEATITAYLDALDEKVPIQESPDMDMAYARFLAALPAESQAESKEFAKETITPKRAWRGRKWLLGLAAVMALLIMAGCAAQIAGVDLVGTVARWTESIFSFGPIRTDGAQTSDSEVSGSVGYIQPSDSALTFASLQDALDYYVIMEIKTPTWLPDGYCLGDISVTSNYDFGIFSLHASYEGPRDTIGISIMRYTDEPIIQAEKSETLVDTFESSGVTFYILDNRESFTIAWCTENFECYIYSSDRDTLQRIAQSMV